MPFQYPSSPHLRRHGPLGYIDYQSCKPWLRDEFDFRCVYCLCRERWFPDGDDSFSVEHVEPRAAAPERTVDYDKLIYACWRCNAGRQDLLLPISPAATLAEHVHILEDGTIQGLTPQGLALIAICRLDRPKLTAFRRHLIELLTFLNHRSEEGVRELRKHYFGFPQNLPDLASLRPPRGNARADGVGRCYFERQKRGELPEVY